MTDHASLHARIQSGDRSAVWELFRQEIAELSTEDLAALTASYEADGEPGLDDAKLTELYAERDRRQSAAKLAKRQRYLAKRQERRAQGHEGGVR